MLANRRNGATIPAKASDRVTYISTASGLSQLTVSTLAQQISWDGVDLPTMKGYLDACGIDFFNRKSMGRVYTRMKKGARFASLRKSGDWVTYYEPLLIKIRDKYARK